MWRALRRMSTKPVKQRLLNMQGRNKTKYVPKYQFNLMFGDDEDHFMRYLKACFEMGKCCSISQNPRPFPRSQ